MEDALEGMEGVDVSEIMDGLYLTSLGGLRLTEAYGITHVLSVVNFPLGRDLSAFTTLQIPLQDREDANLLQHLPQAIQFLNNALPAEGDGTPTSRVLVHCQAGVSRSASVLAAWLMHSRGKSLDEALALLKAARPCLDPNEGFMAQLQLFSDMRCSLDQDHPVYRMLCAELLGKRWEEEGWVDPDSFAQLPKEGLGPGVVGYRCRKCRTLLATSQHVLPVDAAMGHKIFRNRNRQRLVEVQPPPSSSSDPAPSPQEGPSESCIFTDPIDWMSDAVVGVVQGKLHCPGQDGACGARLGSFNWSGITNPSGAWVTPAFQLHMSKLDTVLPPRSLATIPGVRMPRIGPAAAAAVASVPVLPPTVKTTAPAPAGGSAAAAHDEEEDAPVAWQAPEDAGAPAQQQPGSQSAAASSSSGAGARGQGQGQGQRQRRFTHLILDCDGVLVDTERASCESLRRAILAVTGFDIPHQFPHDFNEVFGMDVRSCVAHYQAKFNKPEWGDAGEVAKAVQSAKEELYKELTAGGISPFPGAEPLIRTALRLGMQVGVGSSGAPEKIRHNLSTSNLLHLMDPHRIVSAAQVAAGKPAPDVYIECMRRCGCTDAASALIVEDAINGLKAARAAGAYCVAVCTSLPRDMLLPWADLVVDRLEELDLQSMAQPGLALPGAVPQ